MKIIILTGFLGSGKTTLLLQMAHCLTRSDASDDTYKVVILENEIGPEGIDDKLLQSNGFDVEILSDGTALSRIAAAVNKIEQRFRPDWLIIETTGLTCPEMIRSTLQEELKKEAYICTVVDVSRWKRFLTPMHNLLKGQIECADTVLLNKTDLVNEETLDDVEKDIRRFQTEVNCVRTSGLTAISKDIWNTITKRPKKMENFQQKQTHSQQHKQHHNEYCSHESGRISITSSKQDDTTMILAKYFVMTDRQELLLLLTLQMEALAARLTTMGATIGHIKASLDIHTVETLSITNTSVHHKDGLTPDITVTFTAILFAIADETAMIMVKNMLEDIDRKLELK